MHVFVTGGTGFIGSHSVAALRRAGHSVRLLARDANAVLPALGPLDIRPGDVEVVAGDVTDEAAVRRGLEGCDAVLHVASVYSFDSRHHKLMREVNARGTEIVLGAARQAGIDPIVYVSSFAALMPTKGRPLDPDLPVGRPRERYMATKAEAEQIARRLQDDGAPVTITYPMATLGPHDPHMGDQISRVRSVLLGLMPIWPLGGFPVGDVRDVAQLHAELMQPGQGARRVLAPGTYLSTPRYVRTLRKVTGRMLPTVFMPAIGVMPVGLATQALQRFIPWHIPAEYGAIYTCLCNPKLDGTKSAAPSRPVEETMADSVRWLYESGRLSRRTAGKVAATELSVTG
jgi:nucleoside-diphosphate-sugar epimerase